MTDSNYSFIKLFPVFRLLAAFLILQSCTAPSGDAPDEDTVVVESFDGDTLSVDGSFRQFKATGNEPFWGLWITPDSIQFKSLYEDHGTFNFPYSSPVQVNEYKSVYNSRSASAVIIVEIEKDTCTDSMSGRERPFKVSVDFKRSVDEQAVIFTGCGDFEEEKSSGGRDPNEK